MGGTNYTGFDKDECDRHLAILALLVSSQVTWKTYARGAGTRIFARKTHIVEHGCKTTSPAAWRLVADNSPDHVRTQRHAYESAALQHLSLLSED